MTRAAKFWTRPALLAALLPALFPFVFYLERVREVLGEGTLHHAAAGDWNRVSVEKQHKVVPPHKR